MIVNLIGTGSLGRVYVKHLQDMPEVSELHLFNRTHAKAQTLSEANRKTYAHTNINHLPAATLTILCCPDQQIENCASALALSSNSKPDSHVIHCSGIQSSTLLKCLPTEFIASMHPMRSFTNESNNSLRNVYCGIEGHSQTLTLIKILFKDLDIHWLPISTEGKPLYHAGGVFGANFLISILQGAQQCFLGAGIDPNDALPMMIELAQSVLDNLKKSHSLKASLSGPHKRKDMTTIQTHLNHLPEPERQLYIALADYLSPLIPS